MQAASRAEQNSELPRIIAVEELTIYFLVEIVYVLKHEHIEIISTTENFGCKVVSVQKCTYEQLAIRDWTTMQLKQPSVSTAFITLLHVLDICFR